jgi:hypothetical protein
MRWQQLRPSCLKRSLYKLAYDGKKKSRANKRSGMIFNRRLASDSQHKLKNNAGGERLSLIAGAVFGDSPVMYGLRD